MTIYRPSLGKLFSLTLLILWGLLSPCATAQTADGQRAKDKPGVALVKPQAWSKEDQASVLEFLAFIDRSGYFEFRTAKTPKCQISTALIVKLVVYPESPQSLASPEERAALQKATMEFAALSERFPLASRQFDKAAAPLKADAARYDAGNVKVGGQWLLRSVYYKQKAAVLADLLRPELTSAPRIKEIDLPTNQYFVGLQNLAKLEPSVQPDVESVRSLYESLVRKSDREELLNELNSPAITFDQASVLIAKLKTLQPREDARTNLYLQAWDASVASAGRLTKMITDTQAQFESGMPSAEDPGNVPAISPDLSSSLSKLADAAKAFRSGSPPRAIRVPLQLADAMLACGEKFPNLGKQIEALEFFDAKIVVDPLTNQADIIGPKTSRIIAALQKKINAGIEKFQALRDEGKMLADNNKPDAALKKFQQAYDIIPARDVAARIEALKKK
jgi:hypothetical protein